MDAGLVTWFVRRPLRHEYDKKHELLYPKGYDIYIFDRKDYIENIAAAVKEGKKLVEKSMYNVEIIGYGTNKEGFLMAEPAIWKPSQL